MKGREKYEDGEVENHFPTCVFRKQRLLETCPCRNGVPALHKNVIPMAVKERSNPAECSGFCVPTVGRHDDLRVVYMAEGISALDVKFQKWW